jgi:site-specific DNA recombinase
VAPSSGTIPVPELRIIDDALWHPVKARQARLRHELAGGAHLVRARRPVYLFSGLTRCASCGYGYVVSNRNRLMCSGARDRGICGNRLTIAREEVEARVLRAIQTRLWRVDLFDAYCRRLMSELERLPREDRLSAKV